MSNCKQNEKKFLFFSWLSAHSFFTYRLTYSNRLWRRIQYCKFCGKKKVDYPHFIDLVHEGYTIHNPTNQVEGSFKPYELSKGTREEHVANIEQFLRGDKR